MQTQQQVTKAQQARIVARTQQRIAAVQALRASKNAHRKAVAAQQAFMQGVQELAAQYGVNPAQLLKPQGVNARANSATAKPSSAVIVVNGVSYTPCAAVHALCATLPATATRAQMVQLCTDHGVNKATASTQVGLYRARAKAAQAA